jgi:ABC-type branched-subunit amino acid transport system permease subunit
VSSVLNVQFWAYVGVIAGVYGIVAYSLQLQYGFCGLLNFGQVSFMAVSGYTMAILVVKLGVNLWAASAAALAVSGLFGVLMGIPTLRLRADYFAIVTIAIGEIVDYLANNWTSLTGGATGSINLLGPQNAATYDATWQNFASRVQDLLEHVIGGASSATVASMVVVWVLLVLVGILVAFLVRSPWGRVLAAIRDDEDAASAIGKDVFRYKLQVLAVGGVVAGLAGVLYAFQAATISPADFDPTITFYAWTILILGGATRVLAVPLASVVFGVLYAGVLFFTFPPFSLLSSTQRSYLQLMIVGVVLIVLMRARPQGLLGRREEMLVG